jgi:hypothetical protein
MPSLFLRKGWLCENVTVDAIDKWSDRNVHVIAVFLCTYLMVPPPIPYPGIWRR